MQYTIEVTDEKGSQGVGPTPIEAESEEAAKVIFAEQEGSTVELLAEAGLTRWLVTPTPEPTL